jgi:selenocysteine lyase/cysteine desulfurase
MAVYDKMPSMIPNQRHLFDFAEEVTYLNCGYMSPLLHSVREAGEAGLRHKTRPWTMAGKVYVDSPRRAREAFAQVLGANTEDIAIVPSVSYGVAVAAANVEVQAGQNLVLLAEQFPSNVYAWVQLAERVGATVRHVPRPADGDWTPGVLAAIDSDTALAAIPNCHFSNGSLVDLNAVGPALRAVGALLVADATQSVGALPTDVREIQPDYLICAAYKWLLGPYGVSFLYVAPQHHGGRPIEDNPGGREFNFKSGWMSQYLNSGQCYHDDARRFEQGQADVFNAVPQAAAGVEQVLRWGVPNIYATLRAMTQSVSERAAELGLACVPTSRHSGHLVGIEIPDGMGDRVLEDLKRENIFVEKLDDYLRLSPHLYNSAEDIDRFFEVVEESVTAMRASK